MIPGPGLFPLHYRGWLPVDVLWVRNVSPCGYAVRKRHLRSWSLCCNEVIKNSKVLICFEEGYLWCECTVWLAHSMKQGEGLDMQDILQTLRHDPLPPRSWQPHPFSHCSQPEKVVKSRVNNRAGKVVTLPFVSGMNAEHRWTGFLQPDLRSSPQRRKPGPLSSLQALVIQEVLTAHIFVTF